MKLLSRVQLFAIPWTVAYQAPPSMEFSRQEYWSGVPFPSPGDLSDPGSKPGSLALQADDALPSEPPGKPTFGIKSSEKRVNMLWCMCVACLPINTKNFTTKVQGNVVTVKAKFRMMFKLMVNSK